MKFLDLNTDILAIKCVDNYIFIGIGCFLYAIHKTSKKVKIKINALHPDNIHGIVPKSNNKLIVYGGKSLCIFQYEVYDDLLSIEKIDETHRFQDWIISAEWLSSSSNSIILSILFAHNNIFQYDFYTKQYSNICCKEACLLYAGTIFGQNHENAIIFSGTVFQEILIWEANNKNDKFSEVLHRLKGHKGVLFSVLYNPPNNIICSTSDDRTVRVWSIISNEITDNQRIINWRDVKISLQTTMYGHLARVWRVILFKNILASIGEDSRICFWDLSGNLLHKIEAHQGAPIWCIDISNDEIIYTGGADGSVNSLQLSSIYKRVQNNILIKDNKDLIPKYVSYVDNGDILVYANLLKNCQLLHFSEEYQLSTSYDLTEFSSNYCLMELSLNRQSLALASIQGSITLYTKVENVWNKLNTYKITDSKIFSLQWLGENKIFLSLTDGLLYVVEFVTEDVKILSEHVLPFSRERWVTSACEHDNIIVCGDRMGNVFVYKMSIKKNGVRSKETSPIITYKKIHGRLGVQSCAIINTNLITTGRDGTLRFYKLLNTDSDNPVVEFLHAKNMPMDWVSKLLIHQKNYYVLGFKEDDFVIFDLHLNRIMIKISCGGGHRSWDCMVNDKYIKFIYIQKKRVHDTKIPLDSLFTPPLMLGIHTKEIYCMEMLPCLSENSSIFVSGGEDCTLHVNYINHETSETDVNFKNINILDGHLSSIKCVSILKLVVNESLSKLIIFSGGGRAQLKVWEMTVNISKDKFSKENVSCKDLLSYMLHGPDKKRDKIWVGKELMYNADPETRFMNISTVKNLDDDHKIFVFVACSDGYLRTLRYEVDSNEIVLIHTLAHQNRCILKVHAFVYEKKIFIMTLATDGQLNFWHFFASDTTAQIQKITINEGETISLHQSGINSHDIKSLNDHEYLLATGGDDNLLNLLKFRIISQNGIPIVRIVSSWNTDSVHYAQITGIKITDDKLFSVGADQKIAVHEYVCKDSEIQVKFLKEQTLCIPDIQGMTFCKNNKSDKNLFCIFGKGLQLIEE